VLTSDPQLVHLPVHTSWLNHVFFSIVRRKVLSPNDFYDLADVEDRLVAFRGRYSFTARPFRWNYTR
jgi:hypothetical protein